MAKKLGEMEKALSGYNTLGIRANIVMKSSKTEPFLALIKDVDIGLDNPKVIFIRCEGTESFPVDEDQYETLVKNVKTADYIIEDFIRKMNE
ncbi:MAG: hypothetical protein HRT58_09640 [Crocinitomicaceae bacterium]|nr:hypothetical protein [Flavobacteriales bacterium]NQZ35917.1 hypothetical protein [Crocinitomicaceae bacterium]